jgi:hypothetical protein
LLFAGARCFKLARCRRERKPGQRPGLGM